MTFEISKLQISIDNKPIIKDLSIKSNSNIISFFWESGSWKTTIFNSIINNINYKGKIIVNKKNIKDKINNIGIVFQDNILFPNKNVLDNLLLVEDLDIDLMNKLISDFEIDHIIKSFPHEISWWEIQRICIIRALIKKPKILLLD